VESQKIKYTGNVRGIQFVLKSGRQQKALYFYEPMNKIEKGLR